MDSFFFCSRRHTMKPVSLESMDRTPVQPLSFYTRPFLQLMLEPFRRHEAFMLKACALICTTFQCTIRTNSRALTKCLAQNIYLQFQPISEIDHPCYLNKWYDCNKGLFNLFQIYLKSFWKAFETNLKYQKVITIHDSRSINNIQSLYCPLPILEFHIILWVL